MFARKYIRWISRILIIALLISGNFWGNPVFRRVSAAENPVSYRNVIYPLDENNKDPQGIYYHISGDEAMVGDTSFGAADYQGAGDGVVIIPDAVSKDGKVYDVTNVSSYAFNRCSKLREITVGDNVQKISEGAFCLSGLSKIHIGKQVQQIETTWLVPFEGTKLEEITIDPENTFYTVKDGVLFTADMSELVRYPSRDPRTEYKIPDSVTKISQYAFESVRNVKNMVLPSGVEEIGAAAFEASTALYPVQDLRNVKRLGAMAFADVKNLKMILLGENLQIYMGKAYQNTNQIIIRSGIESLYLPDGTKTSYEVLNGCDGVRSVVFGKGMTLHKGDGAYCKKLETIILPEDLTEIPENFAKGCTSLKSIYIPETVTKIGENAFQDDAVVLYGKKDSAAESYAKEMGLTFEDIDGHVHQYEPYSFYEDEYVTITGLLCTECGHAYRCTQSLLKPLPGTDSSGSLPSATPVGSPSESQEPSATPVGSPSESQEPSATPVESPSESQEPSATPVGSPSESQEPSATPVGSPSESQEPSATPKETPSVSWEPWQFPTVSPKQTGMPFSPPVTTSLAGEPPKSSPAVTPVANTPEPVRPQKSLSVNNFYVSSTDNYKVRLSWTENQYADGYRLFLAEGRNGKYRLLRKFGKSRTAFTYPKQKAGVLYRYKLQAQKKENGSIIYGAFTAPMTIMVTRLVTPSVSVKKKKAGNIPYLQICVKKANADKVQMYVSTNNKSYQAIRLRENSIRKLHGIYRIRYKRGKRDFRIRIRTYKKLRGKTLYSYYSKVVRVRT